MQSEEGREELRQGAFDLDSTSDRILEVRASGDPLLVEAVPAEDPALLPWHCAEAGDGGWQGG